LQIQKKIAPKTQAPENTSANKEKHTKPKESRKVKGVTAEPHPLDRRSGSGTNPWEKKPKRGGGGKFNVGTVQDEVKEGEKEPESGTKEEGETEEPEKDIGITLAEYYQKQGQSQQAEVINESKAKVTQQELLKEIGTAKKIQNKAQTKLDEKETNPKKKKDAAESHVVAMNTEHADLLGFKTGFRTFAERKPLDNTGKPGQTSTQPQAQPTTQEGAQQPELKEVNPPAPEKVTEQAEGEGQRQGNRQPYGEKGPRKYNPNWKGGDRREPRRDEPRRDNKQSLPNFEDDKAFPKLS